MDGTWQRIGALVARRYRLVVAVVVVAAALLAIGLPGLKFETSQDVLIGGKSRTAIDNRRYQGQFGGDAMFVLYTGRIDQLFSSTNAPRLGALESGLRATGQFPSVLGPLTALQFAQGELAVGPTMLTAAKARYPADAASFDRIFATEAGRLAKAGEASLSNPAFVKFLLYDEQGGIRPILRDNFPDPNHALLIVRMRGNLAISEMGLGAQAVKAAVAAHPLEGFTTLSTGTPVLMKTIDDYLQGGMTTLGGLAVLVMLVVLFVVFRRRWRLLSLGLVAVGAVASFGIMGLVGVPLNLVTISGLPIIIGMGVDFAVQMHSRFEEEVEHDGDATGVLRRVLTHLGPALAAAMVAAFVGFLALQRSRVPMIRQFGVMLDIGVAVLFVAVIFLPLAVLTWRERARPSLGGRAVRAGRGLEGMVRTLATVARGWIVPILLVGVVVVGAGLAVEGRFTIQTEPEAWLPQQGSTVQSLKALRADTGTTTELGFLVEAPDVTSSEVAAWMQRFGEAEVRQHPKELLRFTSMAAVASSVTGALPGKEEIDALLTVAPADDKAALISPDHRRANLIFPIPKISLKERGKVLDAMRADLKAGPLAAPPGVTATPAGLAVVGIALVDALQANRTQMTFLALGLVFLLLLGWHRSLLRAVLTLVPVLFAVGASSLVIFATGLELSPLTAVSGPLVIAVCTEFAILIMSRYVEERQRRRTPEDAVDTGTVRIGRAFVASGLTLIGGFGVIASSEFPLLRDFGIIVSLNAIVALLSALIVLPPLLMWADDHPRLTGFCPGPPRDECLRASIDLTTEEERARVHPAPTTTG